MGWSRKKDEYIRARETCYARRREISRELRDLDDANVIGEIKPSIRQERRKQLWNEWREVDDRAREYSRLLVDLDSKMSGMDVKPLSTPSRVRLRGLFASQINPHLQSIKPHETEFSILDYKRDESSLTILFANDDKQKGYLAFNEWLDFFELDYKRLRQ